jgi:sulfur carrier protein
MTVTVNGVIHNLNREMSLTDLLQELSLPPEGIALAVNATVIPRKNHPQTILNDGDVIEIIRAVAGG